jgi:lysozyme family protein
MVGSSLTDDEKDTANTRLKAGFVLLVAASMGLMALQVDPTPLQLAVVFAVGIVVGVGLLWFVLRNLAEYRSSLR